MVLLILGVISYFAATRLFTDDGISRVSEMDLIKNHLRYAQSRAMNTETNWGIMFEPPAKYWLYFDDSSNNKIIVRLPGDDTSTDKKMTLKTLSINSISNALSSNDVKFFSGASDKVSNKPGEFGSPGTSMDISINTTAGTIKVTRHTGFIP